MHTTRYTRQKIERKKYNTLIQHGTYITKYIIRKYNMHTTHHTTHIQHEHVYTTHQYNTQIIN